jgi:NAD+ kinase
MSLFQGRTTPPVLTFGRGTLGFMCVYDLNNYREDIGQIIEGRYTVEYKNRFYGLLEGGARTLDFSYNALNEFCISKNTYVLNLDIFINDMFVT